MRFYDTAQKGLVEFAPEGKTVRIYVCGITPYDAAHLGHVFTFLTYDLLQRRLEDQGNMVQLVRNITDVDEPIYKRAAENNEPYTALAARETEAFQEVMARLNFRQPLAEPKASQYIPQMAEAVKLLLENKHAYRLEHDIYFDISTYPGFGADSGLTPKLQLAFMADRGGDPKRPGKRNPLDFLLWKGITDKKDPAAWKSIVGYGRPGWHIECTVMSSELLKTPLDIHGGGMDLIFPHHAAEAAQSESLGHQPFVRHWLHVAPLLMHGEKMSKSLGNLEFAGDLLHTGNPATLRLALMHYHYRVGGEWRPGIWKLSQQLETDLEHALQRDKGPSGATLLEAVRAAIDDNLDTPKILRLLSDFAHQPGTDPASSDGLRQTLRLLGITMKI
jgi:L-cysteine:1D-myo-inositol 2-amino-2-deoxy-alpha-D-glucopyranoside ligase